VAWRALLAGLLARQVLVRPGEARCVVRVAFAGALVSLLAPCLAEGSHTWAVKAWRKAAGRVGRIMLSSQSSLAWKRSRATTVSRSETYRRYTNHSRFVPGRFGSFLGHRALAQPSWCRGTCCPWGRQGKTSVPAGPGRTRAGSLWVPACRAWGTADQGRRGWGWQRRGGSRSL